MPKVIVFDRQDQVSSWVRDRLERDEEFGDTKAIGLEEDGELIAGVMYNMYSGASISMHIAAQEGKRWMTKSYLYTCFAYPYVQLGCHRVTGLARADNHRATQFIERLGFQQEGLVRMGNKDGTDIKLYGMLKHECRWLEIRNV